MLPSLDNFVSFGSEVIKARPDYGQMLVDIYTTSITAEQLGENDRVNGSQLAESILLNLRGSVDDVSFMSFHNIMAGLLNFVVPANYHQHCARPGGQGSNGFSPPSQPRSSHQRSALQPHRRSSLDGELPSRLGSRLLRQVVRSCQCGKSSPAGARQETEHLGDVRPFGAAACFGPGYAPRWMAWYCWWCFEDI
jgi:hypothetical protein